MTQNEVSKEKKILQHLQLHSDALSDQVCVHFQHGFTV